MPGVESAPVREKASTGPLALLKNLRLRLGRISLNQATTSFVDHESLINKAEVDASVRQLYNDYQSSRRRSPGNGDYVVSVNMRQTTKENLRSAYESGGVSAFVSAETREAVESALYTDQCGVPVTFLTI